MRDFLRIVVMENLHTEDRAAEEILIGCFDECQSIKKVGGRRSVEVHSGQTHDACAVPFIILQKKTDNVESFTLTAKLNAISENVSFLLQACVQNEGTGIHKFNRREILFIGTFYVSFSYELRTGKSLN